MVKAELIFPSPLSYHIKEVMCYSQKHKKSESSFLPAF